MKNLSLIFAFVFSLVSINTNAQSVEEIVNKHLDAIGGKLKLASINSVKMENAMEVMGNSATTTITILNGKGYKTESEIMGSKMVQVINDKGGWMINPMGGSSDPVDLPEAAAKQAASQLFIVPLLDYVSRGIKLSLEGKETVGAAEAYKVKVTNKEGADVTMYIDASTYYLTRLVQTADVMGQTVTNTITYSDFKKTENGWVVPYTTDIDMGGMFQLKNKLSKIEVNPTIDASIFEKK
jgi:outer membrane lipoprotein-sorting protein